MNEPSRIDKQTENATPANPAPPTSLPRAPDAMRAPDAPSPGMPYVRRKRRNRRFGLFALALVVIAAGAAFAFYWFTYAIFVVSTDDAYVGGDLVAVTAREAGTVIGLQADNTQAVKRGQLLLSLDPVDANVALDAAKADLAHTVRAVRTAFARVDQARAQLASAEVTRAQAESDLKRRASAGKAVSSEELAHARDGVVAAGAAVQAAESNLVQALAAVQGTDIPHNPDVLASAARLRQAAIKLARMEIRAPVDGIVAQRSVQLGQHVAAGTPLMAVVPLEHGLGRRQLQGGPAAPTCGSASRRRSPPTSTAATSSITAPSSAWAPAAATPSRCCRRRTPPATGSRSCSACRCASRSIRRSSRSTRCASASRST